MMHWCLVADDRERSVISHMQSIIDPPKGISKYNTQFKVERINIGDYAIMYRGRILAIIERKTWKDMAASIKDGRKRNVDKLLDLRKKTGCSIIYLIEGRAFPAPHRKAGGIMYKNMIAHLDHLMIRDGISYIQTSSTAHTALRLFTLAENMKSLHMTAGIDSEMKLNRSGGKSRNGGDGESKKGVIQLKEKIAKSEDAIIHEIWASIPWITEKTASLLIDNGRTVKQFLLGRVPADELAGLRYPSGAIVGTARAKKMLRAADPKATKIHRAVLLSIPKMGKTTVNKLLATHNMYELLQNPDMIDAKIDGKRIVSASAASNFRKYL